MFGVWRWATALGMLFARISSLAKEGRQRAFSRMEIAIWYVHMESIWSEYYERSTEAFSLPFLES